MIVRCTSVFPTDAEAERMGGVGLFREREFGVVLGREYLVLGVRVDWASPRLGRGAWVYVLMEPDIPTLIPVPLCLFEIVVPRVSRHWEVRASEDDITMWPSSFYRDSYLEDLSNRADDVVTDFWRLHALMEAEAKEKI